MIRLLAQVRRNRTARFIPAPIDVAALRGRFGFALATLRHWERGERKPRGAALVLLHVLARNPRAVISALRPCGNLGPANRSPT